MKRPHSWRFTAKGPSIPAPACIFVPDTRLGVAWLQCGERLNRKPPHATLQLLGRDCRAVKIVIHAAHKTSIKVTTFSYKILRVSDLYSRCRPLRQLLFRTLYTYTRNSSALLGQTKVVGSGVLSRRYVTLIVPQTRYSGHGGDDATHILD